MPWTNSMLPSSMESCHLAQGQDDFHKDALSGTKPGCHFQALRREALGLQRGEAHPFQSTWSFWLMCFGPHCGVEPI